MYVSQPPTTHKSNCYTSALKGQHDNSLPKHPAAVGGAKLVPPPQAVLPLLDGQQHVVEPEEDILDSAEVAVLEDVEDVDDVEHAHPQAPQVPKCLHPVPVGPLPRLAEFHHLDHSENPPGVSAFPPSAPTPRET